MKPSLRILIVAALLVFISSNATVNAKTESAPMCARFTESWHSSPLPTVHLRLAGAAVVFEVRFRSTGQKIAYDRRLLTLRLIVVPLSKAGLSILSHNLRLAFPCRSA